MSQKYPSFSNIKIIFFTLIGIFSLFILWGNLQNYSANITDNTAFSDEEKTTFVTALTENNTRYFSKLSSGTILIDTLNSFKHILDIKTETHEDSLFFSFLGLKKESSILHNVYGIYNKTKNTISLSPPLSVSLNLDTQHATLTITNTSKEIFPADKTLIILPYNITIQSDKTDILQENETKTYFITKELTQFPHITFIESVSYGYKAKVILQK